MPIKLYKEHFVGESNFTVFEENGVYYALNNFTKELISDPDASIVIQSAINTVYALGGGKIFVKYAQYNLSQTLYAKPNVKLESDGAILKRTENFVILDLTNANDFEIKGFVFDGGFINGSNMVYCIGYADRVKILYNKFINPPNNAFMLTFQRNPTYYAKIMGNYFDGCGVIGHDAFAGVPGKSVIAYNYFKNAPNSAITAGAMESVLIKSNIIDSPNSVGISIDSGNTPSYRVTIENNIILNPGYGGINLGWSQNVPIFNAIISGNQIYNSGGFGILAKYGRNLQIKNNIIDTAKSIGIGARGFDNIVITDNIVKDPNNGNYVYYRDTDGIIIMGDALTDYGNIRRNFIVANNIVIDERTTNLMKIGISVHLDSTYNVFMYDGKIENNLIKGATLRSISLVNEATGATGVNFTDYNIIVKHNFNFLTENYGTAVFSGDGTTTQFKIAHGLVGTPKVAIVTPSSNDAKGTFYITVDATYINVNYATAPPSGTNNVVLYWSASV
jgi:hypothetical protein